MNKNLIWIKLKWELMGNETIAAINPELVSLIRKI